MKYIYVCVWYVCVYMLHSYIWVTVKQVHITNCAVYQSNWNCKEQTCKNVAVPEQFSCM